MRRSSLLQALLLCALATVPLHCTVPFAEAATIYWNGGGPDNYWSTAANWSGSTIPTRGDLALFNATSSKNVIVNSNVYVGGIQIAAGYTGTLTQSGTSSLIIGSGSFAQAAGTFHGGNGTLLDNGAFTLSAGTFLAPSGSLGMNKTVQATGGSFSNSGGLVILIGSGQTINAPSVTFRNITLNDGLIGHWTFDETSGSSYADSSGFGAALTRVHNPTFSTTVPTTSFPNSHSVQFTSGSGNVNVKDYLVSNAADTAKFNFDRTQDFSVSIWMKTPSPPGGGHYPYLISTERPNLRTGWVLGLDGDGGGKPFFGVRTSCCAAAEGSTSVTDNQWHHLAGVRQGGTASLYVDGVSQGTFPAGVDLQSPNILTLGMDPLSDFFPYTGYLDDVRVYDRALTQAEIAALAAGNLAPASATLHVLAGNLTADGSMDLDETTLDVSPNNYGVTLGAKLTSTGGIFVPRAGTITFNGSTNGTIILNGSNFYNLTINKPAGTLTSSSNLVLSGSLLITSGTFNAPSGVLSLAGNFANAGAFNANGGTVVLNGTTQTLSGSTTFYNLTKTPAALDTLYFQAGSTQTISGGLLTLQGASPSAKLSLQSTVQGSAWTLTSRGIRSLSNLAVRDSTNGSITTISCISGCVDQTNNSGWDFGVTSSSASTSGGGGNGGGGGGWRGGGLPPAGAVGSPRVSSSTSSLSSSASSPRSSSVSSPNSSSASSDSFPRFSDVPASSWFAPFVQDLVNRHVIDGYRDDQGQLTGLFEAANPVTKAEILKMALLAGNKVIDPAAKPLNVSAQDDWSAPYVAEAETLGLSLYTKDQEVQLPATRGQVIETILEVLGIPTDETTDNPFSDLHSDDPHAGAILTAWNMGIISGDTDAQGKPMGTVRPVDPVNRAEAAKIVALVLRSQGKK